MQQPRDFKYIFLSASSDIYEMNRRVALHISNTRTVFMLECISNVERASLALRLVECGHSVLAGVVLPSARFVRNHFNAMFALHEDADAMKMQHSLTRIWAAHSWDLLVKRDGELAVVDLWREKETYRSTPLDKYNSPHFWDLSDDTKHSPEASLSMQ